MPLSSSSYPLPLLIISRDNGEEYKCKIEGQKMLERGKSDVPSPLLLLLLRLLRSLSPSDRDIDAARPGQSIGCGVEFSSFEPTTFRGKFHVYANGVCTFARKMQNRNRLALV